MTTVSPSDRPPSLFVRELPALRGYLVAAGLNPALTFLEALGFSDDDLAFPDSLRMFGKVRLTGSVRATPEGNVAFAAEPLLEITGPMIEAQLAKRSS